MANKTSLCIKHKMPDGTIMDGPVHGPNQECVEWADGYKKGGKVKNPLYKGDGRKTAKHYSAGGYLVGPSHEQGGIQAIVDGTEPIEVEGGEFIINKQTVDAVGEEFLHKLNSTETTHHTGGFNEGALPSPSKFKDGGKVNNRRSKMARGRRAPQRRRGTAPARRMRRGGTTSTGKRTMARGGGTPRPASRPARKRMLRGGGRPQGRPVRSRRVPARRMANGGTMGSTHLNTPHGDCKRHTSDVTTCNNTPGCHYNYAMETCVGR